MRPTLSGLTLRLTPTETAVLECLLEQESNVEIGLDLGITESTVKCHLHRIARKMGVRSRHRILVLALQYELVALPKTTPLPGARA